MKPANIKMTPDDRVKVLDFGLAKMVRDDAAADSLELSDGDRGRQSSRCDGRHGGVHESGAGKGQPVDKRTDIWAFGCVLFELLTGERAFTGERATDCLVSVLTKSQTGRCCRRLHRRGSSSCCGDA